MNCNAAQQNSLRVNCENNNTIQTQQQATLTDQQSVDRNPLMPTAAIWVQL